MFEAMFVIVPILVAAGFVFVIAMMFSPKLRGKFMSKQVKAMKYMVDESKDDIESITTNMADATKTGIKTTTKAVAEGIKEGFTGEETIYCKHCGATIDADSTFCKKCGKEQ